jgi:hypothetical protein
MCPADFARTTTTLTMSYLTGTAALVALFGQQIQGRGWVVVAHLALAVAICRTKSQREDRDSLDDSIETTVRKWMSAQTREGVVPSEM